MLISYRTLVDIWFSNYVESKYVERKSAWRLTSPTTAAPLRNWASSSPSRTVRDVGYETPTSIQRKTIPVLLAGRDVIGQAPTGTGNCHVCPAHPAETQPQCRRCAGAGPHPARELAIQVAEALHTYARCSGLCVCSRSTAGSRSKNNWNASRGGVQVVVGTPDALWITCGGCLTWPG